LKHRNYNIADIETGIMKKAIFTIAVSGLMCSCGTNQSQPDSTSATNPIKKSISGEDIYKERCVSCHMASGAGAEGLYPPLAKSDFLADKEQTIRQVIRGSSGTLVVNGKTFNNTMPAQPLSDEEVSAVLTYVFGSFGNSGGAVTIEEVKAARAKFQ
jgi:mono/diheme cytochrome c family protein